MLNAYVPASPIDDAGSAPVANAHTIAESVGGDVVVAGADRLEDSGPETVTGFAAIRPVSRGKVLLLANQLAVMTHNGVEVAEALENAAIGCDDPRLRASIQKISEAVSGGQSLSRAVANHGKFFPPTLAPMLAAAEATGEVPQTLLKVCQRMRGEMQMQAIIIGAMIYPIILVGASLVVMSALIIGVLPQFNKVFESLGKPVPPSTQFLMTFGDYARAYWPFVLLGVIGSAVGLYAMRNTHVVRRPIAKLLMYGPMIRGAYRPLMTGRIFRTLAAIVGGGVPMLEAVRLTRRTTRDLHWQELLDTVEEDLIDGKNISSAFGEFDFLPVEAPQMVITAERTGRVAEVLEDIGQFYEEEAGRRIKRLITALEPVIILCMGVVVAGIVMSVMLPLLDVSTTSR